MATSYLTQAQKDSIGGIVDNIHATFARNITVFKISKKTTLTSSSSYNSVYGRNATVQTPVEESTTISARIRYVKMGEEIYDHADGNESTAIQNRIILPAGSVKIKVSNTDHLYVKDAQRAEFDNKRFLIQKNPRPIGMFNATQYWEYFLIPMD